MFVIGKTAEDKETKELSVGKLNQVKKNLIRDYGTGFTEKPDLNSTDLTDGTTNERHEKNSMGNI